MTAGGLSERVLLTEGDRRVGHRLKSYPEARMSAGGEDTMLQPQEGKGNRTRKRHPLPGSPHLPVWDLGSLRSLCPGLALHPTKLPLRLHPF